MDLHQDLRWFHPGFYTMPYIYVNYKSSILRTMVYLFSELEDSQEFFYRRQKMSEASAVFRGFHEVWLSKNG